MRKGKKQKRIRPNKSISKQNSKVLTRQNSEFGDMNLPIILKRFYDRELAMKLEIQKTQDQLEEYQIPESLKSISQTFRRFVKKRDFEMMMISDELKFQTSSL